MTTSPSRATASATPQTDAVPGPLPEGTSGHDHSAPGYAGDRSDYLKRLRRIEGQVRGIHRMVEDDVYCIDVLNQISAVISGLQSVSVGLVRDHVSHCVDTAVRTGDEDEIARKMEEITAVVTRLVKK